MVIKLNCKFDSTVQEYFYSLAGKRFVRGLQDMNDLIILKSFSSSYRIFSFCWMNYEACKLEIYYTTYITTEIIKHRSVNNIWRDRFLFQWTEYHPCYRIYTFRAFQCTLEQVVILYLMKDYILQTYIRRKKIINL